MEIGDFITWFIVIASILGIGGGTMLWAYIGSGSRAILFPEPIKSPLSSPDTQLNPYFQQGCGAYETGKYRLAVDQFSQAIRLSPSWAEAFHNRGLAWANLRQDDKAAADLVRAGELYAGQDNEEGIAAIKQNLEALKIRKSER